MNKNQQQQLKELKTKLNNIPHNNDPSEPQMKSPDEKSKSWASDKPPSKQTSTIPEEPSESSPESSSTQNICFPLSTNNHFSPLIDEAKTTDLPKPSPESSSQQLQDSRNTNPTVKTYNSETIMCDSNGRLLNTKRLCPNTSCTYIRCSTLSQAEEIISNSVFTKPRTLIFHCGTNDLDNSDENSKVCSDLLKIIDKIKAKYPECQIILSSLLPRVDNQQPRINKINQNIKEECSKFC